MLINFIKDDNGEWLESRAKIRYFLIKKFLELFKAEHKMFCDYLENYIQVGVSDLENSTNYVIPSAKEILRIVRSIHPIKVFGPDGVPPLFFQRY